MRKNMFCVSLLSLTLLCLGGCGSANKEDTTAVKTSRVTSETIGAIKAEETNIIPLHCGDLRIDPRYRVAVSEDANAEITSYFIFNNDKVNAIADERDGRSGDDYYNAIKEAWDKAQQAKKEQAEKFSFLGKKENIEETTETEVFIFDTDAYITPYHEDIAMYVYSGIDRATPSADLRDFEIKASIRNYVDITLGANVQLYNALYDTFPTPQKATDMLHPELNDPLLNGDFYVLTFTANAGNKIATTYGYYDYAKQYYGIYFMEKDCWDGSFRRWYGIVFANDSVGEIVENDFYEDIFNQLNTTYAITRFYTDYLDVNNYFYDPKKDYRYGKSYEQLLDTFQDTKDYYILLENGDIEISTETESTEAEKEK